MPIFSNVFLVSSPLQAVVVDALLRGTEGPDRGDSVVFVEDERFVNVFEGVTCVPIGSTRLDGKRHIADNLAAIDRYLGDRATLWVSDILWPMNNALYTRLLRQDRLSEVNFFDEGIVLYWQDRLTRLNLLREWMKFRVLRYRLGVPFTCPARDPFRGNRRNGKVYALHPELLADAGETRAVELDLAAVARLSEKLEDGDDQAAIQEGSALVLSQPYYRITRDEKFAEAMAGFAAHLRSAGHRRLYVKLHPSEGPDLFDRHYRDLGFEIAFPGMKAPVETVLASLPGSCTLASFNSSALLNAAKFGFRGKTLSYGLNWVAAQYPLHRKLFDVNVSLFRRAGVEVALH